MTTLEKHSINSPDEVREFQDHGHADIVTIGDFSLARAVFEPGWKWSNDLKPIAGTASCQTRHTGVCLAGEMTVRGDDGSEATFREGDVFVIEPGHDAWVDGDVPCIMIDTGMSTYAKPR
jgi:hypothetical protein